MEGISPLQLYFGSSAWNKAASTRSVAEGSLLLICIFSALLSRGTKPSEQEQGSKDKTIILFVVSLAKQLGREWEEREQLLPSLQGSSSNTGSSFTQHMAGSDAMQQQHVSGL